MKQYISFLTPCVIFLLLIASCNKDALKRGDDENLSDLYQTELFNISQEDLYYWHGKEKIYFKLDKSLALVEIMESGVEKAVEFLSADQTIALRMEDKNTLQLITTSEGALNIAVQHKGANRIRAIYPAIKTLDGVGTAFITNKISIKFPDNTSKVTIDEIARKYHLTLAKETLYGSYIFETNDTSQTFEIANAIHESENVLWSSPDFVMIIQKSTDTLYPLQYYLNNTGQGGGTFNIDINAPEAWNITIGCNIRVAVIDDGIDAHDEFTGRLLSGFTAGANNTLGVPLNHVDKGHGVNCAGIIGAAHNNGDGIKGIAPNTLLIPINIFPYPPSYPSNPSGAASSSDIATAIHWAWHPTLGNADVLSNSWGGGAPSTDISSEINNARTSGRGNKGSVVVFASGNGGATSVSYPSSLAGVIAVGAINRNGNIWNYSNQGSQLSLVAPSGALSNTGDVVTTDRMGTWGVSSGDFSHVFGGTSAACPQVSGVAALLLSMNPNLTEAQVRTTLQNTATDMGSSGFDNTFGYGRVNAFAALNAIAPSISGANTFCTSSTYTLNNLPTGATVSWTATSGVTLSPSGNNVTVSRTGTTYLNTTLTANITSACGAVVKITKKIESGAINAAEISVYAMPTSTSIGYPVHVVAGYKGQRCEFPEVQWEVSSSSYNMTSGSAICAIDNGSSKNIIFTARGSFSVKARIRNNCGWSGWSLPTFITVN
ncbi:hypothetical protein FAZ15_11720 [Sphingobacterium olei]|uniref:Peptidase S8/S53 domain-containing protein n=1 Tax=Sphingobacterium olei TaxID=2571155 RepID=A0A4U0P0L2_9SPHI|nr:S8 family serine peptidase [Sphingobacterium olei]TJZ60653.1 hypothetical protein FAZ15_11720 [Sphingobacterium olei]